jgi:sporulation protein YlmC with PRC-barrel domain
MNFIELMNQDVFVDNQQIAKVKDVVINPEEWKITHIIVELTKNAAEEVLGATYAVKGVINKIAISALEKGMACCTNKGVEMKVTKKQLNIYLRPA